jgi:hypothetical protein
MAVSFSRLLQAGRQPIFHEPFFSEDNRRRVPLPARHALLIWTGFYLRAGSRRAKAKDMKRLVVAQRFSRSK